MRGEKLGRHTRTALPVGAGCHSGSNSIQIPARHEKHATGGGNTPGSHTMTRIMFLL